VILSVLGTSLAFWLWFAALEQIDLNRANAFTFLVPIFGLAIGAALFEERLVWVQAAGAVLVLTGIVLVQRGARAATVEATSASRYVRSIGSSRSP
jgi:drug/metabolite transporter (DMT)-like permease